MATTSTTGRLVKIYGPHTDKETQRRYSPSEFVKAERLPAVGNPEHYDISTSYIERQNLTMRMSMRRFTRLTNGFSKKIENHMHAISLHYFAYNFTKIHSTLKMTPAMKAGITDSPYSLEFVADLIDKANPIKKRGPYKKRVAA